MSILQRLPRPTKTSLRNVLVIFIGVVILLGSTFAWRDLSQHKTNPWGNLKDPDVRDVTLNDQYTPVELWKPGETIEKVVSVTNLEASPGNVCVRVSLREFLQLREQPGEEIRDHREKLILFATFAEGERKGDFMTVAEAKKLGIEFYGSYFVYDGVDPVTGGDVFVEYATTNNTVLANGMYGKPMKKPGKVLRIWGDAPRANISHTTQDPVNGECNYIPYYWEQRLDDVDDKDGSPWLMYPEPDRNDTIRDYIALNTYVEAEVVSLETWAKPEAEQGKGGKLGDYWIVDPSDGWVYWGSPLPPGTTTANLLNDVTLTKHPAKKLVQGQPEEIGTDLILQYYIHLDMQATDETERELIQVFAEVENATTFDELQALIDDGTVTSVSPEKFELLALLNNPQRNEP